MVLWCGSEPAGDQYQGHSHVLLRQGVVSQERGEVHMRALRVGGATRWSMVTQACIVRVCVCNVWEWVVRHDGPWYVASQV